MGKRNEFLEIDGLSFQNEDFEFFKDNTSTSYAQTEDLKGVSLKLHCYCVRNKNSGDYIRAIIDHNIGEVIYEAASLESIGFHIDKLKVMKHFECS